MPQNAGLKALSKKIRQAEALYKRVADELESKHMGKVIGFHLESGKHYIGGDEIQAYDQAALELKGPFELVYLRIGSKFLHFVG